MNKVIIVDGPDNVGKSTLIRNLKNKLNNEIFINLSFSNIYQKDKESYIYYSKQLYNNMFKICEYQIVNLKNSIIIDRSHISEMVYSPMYRNYSGDYVLDIEKKYDLSNFFLILLIDTPENLISRDDGLSYSIDINKKNKELKLFHNAFEKTKIKKIIINIDGHDEQSIMEQSIHFIQGKL